MIAGIHQSGGPNHFSVAPNLQLDAVYSVHYCLVNDPQPSSAMSRIAAMEATVPIVN